MTFPDSNVVSLLHLVRTRTAQGFLSWEKIGDHTFRVLSPTGTMMIVCDQPWPQLPWFGSDDNGEGFVILAQGEVGLLRSLGQVVRISSGQFAADADECIADLTAWLREASE